MGLFFLGLAIGLILGLNYRMVTDRLAALFAPPSSEPAPHQPQPQPPPRAEERPKELEEEAPIAGSPPKPEPDENDQRGEGQHEDDEAPPTSPIAAAAPKGPVSIVFESREPSWVDVPFVKKPKVEFSLESADPRRPGRTLTLALGERGQLAGEAGERYQVRARLVGMSRALWVFNAGGRFDSTATLVLGAEPARVFYETPATLREPGRLALSADGPVSAASSEPA